MLRKFAGLVSDSGLPSNLISAFAFRMEPTSQAIAGDEETQQNLKTADLFYTALHDLTGYEFEVRKDQQSVYIYHSSCSISKKATNDCILHALYGIMLSTDVCSIHIEGFGRLTRESMKKHIRFSLDNIR